MTTEARVRARVARLTMRLTLRLATVAAAAAIPALLGAVPRAAAAQQAIDLPVGATAPDLKLETLDGKPANLSAYLGKVPMMIEVWAAWCENCEALAPRILAAKKKYGDQVRFIGLAVSFNQSPARVKKHMAQHGFDLEMFYDRSGEADAVYGVKATSTIIVVDRKGKIVYAGAGADQDVEAAIRKAL
jgi:thiol-disulfide isomerase/thioredoxin